MFSSWPVSALVAGVKIGSGSRRIRRRPRAARCRTPRRSPGIPSSRSREVAARHALDRERRRLLDQHRPPAQHVAQRRAARRDSRRRRRDQMVLHDAARTAEPEPRQLREDPALVGDARGNTQSNAEMRSVATMTRLSSRRRRRAPCLDERATSLEVRFLERGQPQQGEQVTSCRLERICGLSFGRFWWSGWQSACSRSSCATPI